MDVPSPSLRRGTWRTNGSSSSLSLVVKATLSACVDLERTSGRPGVYRHRASLAHAAEERGLRETELARRAYEHDHASASALVCQPDSKELLHCC